MTAAPFVILYLFNKYSEEKVKSVQTLCAIILLVSLNIDKHLTQHEIVLISYKCEHFQQNILKINRFSSPKSHKGVNIKIQISKLKNQSSAYRQKFSYLLHVYGL